MGSMEKRIKDFLKEQGVEVAGIAGPDRLDGPPSLDPTYTLRGARSVVSFALPMDVGAIYDFLSKKSPAPHNVDQTRMNQKAHGISSALAAHLAALGFPARAVPSNNTYRRSPDPFATHPSFSHRFGAMAAGIAAQGWSGNVMTQEYGAAVYLGSVVCAAALESDPARFSPRHFVDGYCARCKVCEKTCVAGMFEPDAEEYVLLNGQLHPRGRRRNIDLCNASCFGLHALSRDKKWTTWGHRWIKDWVDAEPDPARKMKIRWALMKEGSLTGDSTARYDLIRTLGQELVDEAVLEAYLAKRPEKLRESERFPLFKDFARNLGVSSAASLQNDRILTCGQCALVCGPSVAESARRYRALESSGLVAPGPGNEMVNAATYGQAASLREKHMPRVPKANILKDALASGFLWTSRYQGIEPRSIIAGWLYANKLKKAVSKAQISK